MVAAENAPARFHDLLEEGAGFGVFRLVDVEPAELVHRRERRNVLLAGEAPPDRQGLPEKLLRFAVVAEVGVNPAESLHQRRLGFGKVPHLEADPLPPRVEKVPDREGAAPESPGIGPLEEPHEAVGDPPGRLGFLERLGLGGLRPLQVRLREFPLGFLVGPRLDGEGAARLGFDAQTVRLGVEEGHPDSESRGEEDEGGDAGEGDPVAHGQLPQAVERARRPGRHDLPSQVPLHVGGEALGRLVAPRPVLLQGLHHDPVEIAANELSQRARFGEAAPRDVRELLAEGAQPLRGRLRVLLADEALDLVEPLRGDRLRRRGAWCPSAARRAGRPASRRRTACPRPVPLMSACSGLMYSGVPMNWPKPGEDRLVRQSSGPWPWRRRSR